MQIENLHHYVFVRQDISVRQQAVQSNHATFLLARTLPHTVGTPNLVLIGVSDAAALRAVMQTLDTNNIEYVAYEEPANNMGLSSIATVPLGANDRLCLSGFKTWKPITSEVQGQNPASDTKFTRRQVLKALCGVESLLPAPCGVGASSSGPAPSSVSAMQEEPADGSVACTLG